jgi:hypothetical protein
MSEKLLAAQEGLCVMECMSVMYLDCAALIPCLDRVTWHDATFL